MIRTNFDTCVPSVLYRPPPPRKPSAQAFVPSASALPDPDPERAPLLAHSEGGKYT